jgi:hypothetical protein
LEGVDVNGKKKQKQTPWVWNGAHPAFVRIIEELLDRKVAAAV